MNDEMIFREHAARYPAMRPADAVKLAFQAEYGVGHLIDSPDGCLAALKAELAQSDAAAADSSPAIEAVGGGYVRVNLAGTDIPPRILCHMMCLPAARTGTERGFTRRLDILRRLCSQGVFSFAPDMLEEYISCFSPIPRHSPEYRRAYKPAYRIIDTRFIPLLPLIRDIEARTDSGHVSVAVDGRAASGKSTLAALLAFVCDCNLFHADDYFLPQSRKTPDRLAEPGGNIDYERLNEEIISRLGQDTEYRPYDCSRGRLGDPVRVRAKRIDILEGSYSCHPYFGDAWDIRVFCTVPPAVQRERILARNGEAMLARFEREWIPMEEKYFRIFNIVDKADYILDNTVPRC